MLVNNDPTIDFAGMQKKLALEMARMKIVDEKTGTLLKVIDKVNDFFVDMNYNLIVSNRVSIRYFSFNCEFLNEVITGKDVKLIHISMLLLL